MNGIVEVILEMLIEDTTYIEESSLRNLCCSIKSCVGINCFNCPFSSANVANKNMKKLYGDTND